MGINPNNHNQSLGSISQEVWDLQHLIKDARLLRAIEEKRSVYPIFREFHITVSISLSELFDRLTQQTDWALQRVDACSLVIESEGAFVNAWGTKKPTHSTAYFEVWANSYEDAEHIIFTVETWVGEARVLDPMFSIQWYFLSADKSLQSAFLEEFANDVLYDEAYPALPGGVAAFVKGFLAADETVLVLQGPPGTGKTRLIRAIMGELSRQRDNSALALYTGDKRILESDELFVNFLTGRQDAFIVEDADHLLKSREEGNENLHRFLAIADGVVKAQGRKIIFSTNLPDLSDIDPALIRPGRCFARVDMRLLSKDETLRLVEVLCEESHPNPGELLLDVFESKQEQYSLAEVYKLCRDARK